MSKSIKRIAIAGNPNTGKSSVFNALSGAKQTVANYPGVTIEKKVGRLQLANITDEIELIDLPGSYSLRAISIDEQVASDTLMGRIENTSKPDLIIFILDALNIERNLFLYSQIIETKIPIIIVVTMSDLLEKENLKINFDELQKILKVTIFVINTRKSESINQFKKLLAEQLQNLPKVITYEGIYPNNFEQKLNTLQEKINPTLKLTKYELSNIILFNNDPMWRYLSPHKNLVEIVKKAQKDIVENSFAHAESLNNSRYSWIKKIINKVQTKTNENKSTYSQKIDKLLTHRIFGLVIFVSIFYLVFRSIYSWATPFMNGIEYLFSLLGNLVASLLAGNDILVSLVRDGIIGGVGSVVIFLPQIIFLFVFISILEASGYMARASFLMDKLLSWTGLNGRAFIPMLSSFACAVPGIMAARVMPDPKARITTVLIAPLMSCSARLPVYLLLISAFIEPHYGVAWATFALFAMHSLGLIIGLPIAFIINRGLLKTPSLPFILELPPYRMPHLRNVFYRVVFASKKFLKRAGTIIFFMSIIIWFLSYFPRDHEAAKKITQKYDLEITHLSTEKTNNTVQIQKLEVEKKGAVATFYLGNSMLGQAGKFIQPIFAPLGFDWKISVGILSAFPAREVIISTLGILYNASDDASATKESSQLKNRMINDENSQGVKTFTPLVAITLMIFFALCAQCFSTLVTVQKELNATKWAVFLFFYMTTLAYVISLTVYQIGIRFS